METKRPAGQVRNKGRASAERALKEYEARVGTGELLKVTDMIRLLEAGISDGDEEANSISVEWGPQAHKI
jgi:hypothetical protein